MIDQPDSSSSAQKRADSLASAPPPAGRPPAVYPPGGSRSNGPAKKRPPAEIEGPKEEVPAGTGLVDPGRLALGSAEAKTPAATPPVTPAATPPVTPAATPPVTPPAEWPPKPSSALNEPTERLPVLSLANPPAVPPRFGSSPTTPQPRTLLGRRPPPARVAGRAVLVYEQQLRRPWRLWVFTAVLVSLTVGVVLGQAEAYQPATGRSAAGTQPGTVVVPGVVVPSDAVPSAAVPQGGAPVPLLSAPLGQTKERRLEVIGSGGTLRLRMAELGDALINVNALDPTSVPKLTDSKGGTRLELATTGANAPAGTEVVLNAKVAWTLGLGAGLTELSIDGQAGGLAGIDLGGGASRSVLQLPKPKGTVPVNINGNVGELTVHTAKGAPVRVRFDKGAPLATLDGKANPNVKPGTTLSEPGWKAAKTKYDIKATGTVSTLLVDRLTTAN